MKVRLVALDDGHDIVLDRDSNRDMMIVGRHPDCDARLDSLRVSRRHCCMTVTDDGVIVRDLGSTNGIRINGQRVDKGHLRAGDELAIAHIRYRLEAESSAQGQTILDRGQAQSVMTEETSDESESHRRIRGVPLDPVSPPQPLDPVSPAWEHPPVSVGSSAASDIEGAAPVNRAEPGPPLPDPAPAGLADRCRIQVQVQMSQNQGAGDRL